MQCRLISEPRLQGLHSRNTDVLCLIRSQKGETSPVLISPPGKGISNIWVRRAHCVGEGGSSSTKATLCPPTRRPL